jgi:hypothetical protein
VSLASPRRQRARLLDHARERAARRAARSRALGYSKNQTRLRFIMHCIGELIEPMAMMRAASSSRIAGVARE